MKKSKKIKNALRSLAAVAVSAALFIPQMCVGAWGAMTTGMSGSVEDGGWTLTCSLPSGTNTCGYEIKVTYPSDKLNCTSIDTGELYEDAIAHRLKSDTPGTVEVLVANGSAYTSGGDTLILTFEKVSGAEGIADVVVSGSCSNEQVEIETFGDEFLLYVSENSSDDDTDDDIDETTAPKATEKPSETDTPSETTSPSETADPSETTSPSSTASPSATTKPSSGGSSGGSSSSSSETTEDATAAPTATPKPTVNPNAVSAGSTDVSNADDILSALEKAGVSTDSSSSNDALFTDISDHWAKDSITKLSESGIIAGFEDNTFRPDENVTRAQFVKMLISALGETPESDAESVFADVSGSEWYAPYVMHAYSKGYVNGSDGNFLPQNDITRAEISAIISRAFGISSDAAPEFTDTADIPDWAMEGVGGLCEKGILKGFEDGTFLPNKTATRAEAAVILERAMQQ